LLLLLALLTSAELLTSELLTTAELLTTEIELELLCGNAR
jgi:hypothetical protein